MICMKKFIYDLMWSSDINTFENQNWLGSFSESFQYWIKKICPMVYLLVQGHSEMDLHDPHITIFIIIL
jgi:hypothetical protein